MPRKAPLVHLDVVGLDDLLPVGDLWKTKTIITGAADLTAVFTRLTEPIALKQFTKLWLLHLELHFKNKCAKAGSTALDSIQASLRRIIRDGSWLSKSWT